MLQDRDPKQLAQIALVVLLIIGCIAVLLPFVGALLFACVVGIYYPCLAHVLKVFLENFGVGVR